MGRMLSETEFQVADAWIKILAHAGIDPRKAARNPMAVALAAAWIRQDHDTPTTIRALRNLAILNPLLKRDINN